MKYCISVADIYGTDSPKVPEGYKLTGEFRPPLKGEWFISLDPPNVGNSYPNSDAPKHVIRLILEKLPPKPTIESIYGTKEPKIPEGYESTGEFRPVRKGEVFLGATLYKNTVVEAVSDSTGDTHRLILRKVKPYSDAEILAHILENLTEGTRYGRWEVWRGESIKSIKNRIIAHMREDGK